MAYYEDLSQQTQVVKGRHIRAIGWLSPEHPYTKGKPPEAFVDQLRKRIQCNGIHDRKMGLIGMMGLHSCEFCDAYTCGGEFGIPNGKQLFVAPKMILHYVEEHDYLPPQTFIDAFMKAPFPDTQAYAEQAEYFWIKNVYGGSIRYWVYRFLRILTR